MNLESDKRLNIQLRLDFSSAPTGEARQAGREDIESLSVVSEPERPAITSRIFDRSALAKPLEPPYTDPYVRWCGRGGAARLPPIPISGTKPTYRDVRYQSAFGGNADNQPVIAGQSRFMSTRPSKHEPVGGPGMSQVSEYSFEKMARPLT